MLVHLNGQLLPPERAHVSVFDRGFVFGDGVYEGLRAFGGRIVGEAAHAQRMAAGLREARIEGFDPAAVGELSRELLRANALDDAFLYWQVTRGCPRALHDPEQWRTRTAPPGGLAPTVFGYAAPLPSLEAYAEPATRAVAVRPDTRWLRGHVKSISLMGGVLAALEAVERGAADAVFVRDGLVKEGVATNVLIARGGRVATPPLEDHLILAGVTRRLLLEAEPSIEVRDVPEAELRAADEVMLVGTSTMLVSVTSMDGAPVGDGRPGPVARRLLRALVAAVRAELGLVHLPR